MTVCIAASCFEGDDPRIVICKDWRGEVEGLGSYDSVQKLKRLSGNWISLVANNISRAEELCLRYEYSLRANLFTEENFANELRRVFNEYKKAMADSFLRSKYGFSFDQLIAQGKTAFGEDFVSACFQDVSRLSVPADLIVAGFLETFDYEEKGVRLSPMLASVSEANEGDPVILEGDYAAIGSGSSVARSMLLAREQSSDDSLMETVYSVFEAKTMCEDIPGVGDSFSVEIFYPDGSLKTLSTEGNERCKELWRRFGFRSYTTKKRADWFKFDDKYFEPYRTPKQEKESPDL
jgi:hypothetical protein